MAHFLGIKRKESDPDILYSKDSGEDIEMVSSAIIDDTASLEHSPSGEVHLIERRKSADDRSQSSQHQLKSIGIFRLSAILFFMGYGGSYGVEGALSTGPPHYVLLSFMFAPFVWALPEALVTAELSSALPNVGGNARKAFGTFLAWQSGFWALLSIPSAVGIFPVMFVSNLERLLGVELPFIWVMISHLVMIIVICSINILGVKSVGGGNLVFSLLVLTPFLLFVIVGLPKWDWKVLTSKEWEGTIQWQAMVTQAIWSCGGWTNGGQIAGEIHNPRKSFNFAILIVMGLTLTFSLIPLSIAASVNPTIAALKAFKIGSWITTAKILSGEWLGFFLAFGAMFSALGEMNSSFCAQARMLSYLSSCEDFSFPRWFAKLHPTYQTPYVGVIVLGATSFVMSLLPFTTIVSTVVFLASISIIITFVCLIRLRINFPEMDRPFKVPLGTVGLVYTCGVGIAVASFNIIIAPIFAKAVGGGLVVAGFVLYYLVRYIKRR